MQADVLQSIAQRGKSRLPTEACSILSRLVPTHRCPNYRSRRIDIRPKCHDQLDQRQRNATALTLTGATTGAGSSAVYNATLDSYYAIVSTAMTWEAAMDNAQASFLSGVSGTLVNINSADEQSYLVSIASGSVFIGASDKVQEGIWRWYNGDTADLQFSSGGTAVGSVYTSWQNTMPDNLGNEDYGQMFSGWSYNWNDTTGVATGMSIVEWTGTAFRAAQGVAGSVMENATAGTVVGTLAATDADSGETLTYSIVGANANFEVVGNQLRVRTGASLNFEAASQHTLTVRVTDSANNTRDQLVTISVVNVNEAPIETGVIGSTNLVSNGSFETNTNGWTLTGAGTQQATTVGSTAGSGALAFSFGNTANGGVATTTISTAVGQMVTVTFDLGAYAGPAATNNPLTMNFQVVGASTLVNEMLVDAGTNPNTFNSYRYSFIADSTATTLRFEDTSSSTNSIDWALDNVQAYALTTTNPSMSIAESSANGSVVGQVASTDSDAYSVVSYSLANSANGRFAINSTTGAITVASSGSLDFEAAQSHTIVVRTTDQGGLTFDKTMTINLTNINEAPVDIRTSTAPVTVQNFSFESDILADGNWTGTPSNWTVTGTAGVGNPTSGNLSSGNPTDGLNYGWVRNGSSLSNTLSTNFDSNQNYQLTLDFGSQLNMAPGTAAIRLYAGGTLIGSYTSNAPNQDVWNTASFLVNGSSFVAANGGALRIELANTSGATSEVLFDNVRLTSSSATGSVAENAANGAVVGTVTGLDLDAGTRSPTA